MPIPTVLIVVGGAIAWALSSGKKKKKPPKDDFNLPSPFPTEPGPPAANGCELDAGIPALLRDHVNAVLANLQVPATALEMLAVTCETAGFPKAAACLRQRAAELAGGGGGGGGGGGPSPGPGAPPTTPGPGIPEDAPPGWPPNIPWPPWGGGGAGAGADDGSTMQTVVKANDTAYGYAQFYSDVGGGVAAVMAAIKADNPHLAPLATGFVPGKPLFLRSAWVAAKGLPPLPTSNYHSGGGGAGGGAGAGGGGGGIMPNLTTMLGTVGTAIAEGVDWGTYKPGFDEGWPAAPEEA